MDSRRTERARLFAILLVLFATGWAANHFTALLPVLAASEHLSRTAIDGAFGIYAVGLLPGLLGGGALSDRIGRRPLLLTGAAVAGLGNLALLLWHDQTGIFVGRLIVGAGVGVAMSSGTAWCADIAGVSGSALAGVFLSTGFGSGALFSGLLGQFSGSAIVVPFVATIGLSTVVVLTGFFFAQAEAVAPRDTTTDGPRDSAGGVRAALAAALPMALWVFSCATVAMVTMAERMQYRFQGPLLPGIAAAIVLTAGVAVQIVARRRGWGRGAGAVGALSAAAGFGVCAAAADTPPLAVFLLAAVLLGCAYGLCLRAGLVDVEALAPPSRRGTLTGVFWAVTYLGFGLPVLLTAIRPTTGSVAPLLLLTVAAAGVAVVRVAQVRRTAA